MSKTVIISVTNDLVSDKRINKVAHSLIEQGHKVICVGRKLKSSLPDKFNYRTKRFKLIFNKSALFYAEYNFRLFFFLLFVKADIFLSNDLDTLTANYFASKIRRKKLVYDSHEYFTEVPELQNRKTIKKIWTKIEKFILPKVKFSYTVCQSIADVYNKKYKINMQVVRNIPECKVSKQIKNSIQKIKTENEKLIIYQGALNMGRGLEPTIEAMQYIENAKFMIIGGGDIEEKLREKVEQFELNDKVIFTGKIPFSQLYQYTSQADLGISLEENIGLNYYYALPNKLFDYIKAEIPILASKLPEIENIVKKYKIGDFIDNHSAKHIASKIKLMINNQVKLNFYKQNIRKIYKDLCWENEFKHVLSYFV